MEPSTQSASHLPASQHQHAKTTDEKRYLQTAHQQNAPLSDNSIAHGIMPLRQIFAHRLVPVAFALPILAAFISTLEVLSIVAVFIYTSLRPDTFDAKPGKGTTLKEKTLRAWFWFLFISPFVTSTMVVLMASDISCDPEDDLDMHQPICQVGIRLIKATALCRAGIIATFLFATSSWLDQRPKKPCSPDESA
ncbi:hypothetical protein FGRMN_5171 [Fusarium graminum]|nr:hypothetical protein FGRMN_5171 [Fusarium graminum]